MSWKLSCTVLRGGTASNGGSLLDKKTGTGKQPYAIALADRGMMALAGLWENGWQTLTHKLANEPIDLAA